MSTHAKQITVGFDGTAESTEAVRWAADEAVARKASLHIVSCYTIPVIGDPMSGWVAAEAYTFLAGAAETSLSRLQTQLSKSHSGLAVTSEASPDRAAFVLVDRSRESDMVVVGASSHEGGAAVWLGSTPRHLVRRAACPVAVVRGATSRGRPDRVVVGVDGSPGATVALNWAADEADLHGVALTVVHAWDYAYPYPTVLITTDTAQARDLTEVDAANVLEHAAGRVRERSSAPVTSELVEGSAVSALLGAVRDGDLLVLGSRGRGAVAATLFGSTVNAVLDAAAVPVVVVRETTEAN